MYQNDTSILIWWYSYLCLGHSNIYDVANVAIVYVALLKHRALIWCWNFHSATTATLIPEIPNISLLYPYQHLHFNFLAFATVITLMPSLSLPPNRHWCIHCIYDTTNVSFVKVLLHCHQHQCDYTATASASYISSPPPLYQSPYSSCQFWG